MNSNTYALIGWCLRVHTNKNSTELKRVQKSFDVFFLCFIQSSLYLCCVCEWIEVQYICMMQILKTLRFDIFNGFGISINITVGVYFDSCQYIHMYTKSSLLYFVVLLTFLLYIYSKCKPVKRIFCNIIMFQRKFNPIVLIDIIRLVEKNYSINE